MDKNKHLTDAERLQIEQWLKDSASIKQIALKLGKSTSTVSRKIRSRSTISDKYAPYELCEFLQQFGIDVAKPIEQWSVVANKDENKVDNVVYYAVNGTVNSADGYEIDISPVQIVVMAPKPDDVIHCPENSPNIDFEESYFVFEIFSLWLPWTVDDDINDGYPEPRTFGQRVKALFKQAFIRER